LRDLLTAYDAVEYITDFLGSSPDEKSQRDVRRSIQAALREISSCFNWPYYARHYRIVTSDPYSTGQCYYEHTGNILGDRILTILFGVTDSIPDWSEYGRVLINGVSYEVARVFSYGPSSATLQFEPYSNPGQDLGTSIDPLNYMLYRVEYQLPEDFIFTSAQFHINRKYMEYVPPSKIVEMETRYNQTVGTPYFYTIIRQAGVQGRMAARYYPIPSTSEPIDMIFQRAHREIRVWKYNTGKLSTPSVDVIQGENSASLTQLMAGSVLWLGTRDQEPTGDWGTDPPFHRAIIVDVDTVTNQATIDPPLSSVLPFPVKYIISDPIDVEPVTMNNLFFRCAEKHLSVMRKRADKEDAYSAYREELIRAREANHRTFEQQGPNRSYGWTEYRYIGDRP